VSSGRADRISGRPETNRPLPFVGEGEQRREPNSAVASAAFPIDPDEKEITMDAFTVILLTLCGAALLDHRAH